MSSPRLILGFSPYNAPQTGNGIFPFDEIYDEGLDLLTATEKEISKCHALLLWGGADIATKFYNERRDLQGGPEEPSQRDLFEWELLRRFSDENKPIIGVCRGAQLICAFAGGKLVQHVTGHNYSHNVTTIDNKTFYVSSSHHQMMYPYDVNHDLLAWSTRPESINYQPKDRQYCIELEQRRVKEPEVVFFPDINALAIQPHPEWHGTGTNAVGKDFNKWIHEIILDNFFE